MSWCSVFSYILLNLAIELIFLVFSMFSMVNYQNFAVKLTTILAIALINLIEVFPAVAITQDFQLNSDRGYRVETNFSYDETKSSGMLAEQGKESNLVDSLKVSFYDPDGKMIASYDNIVDGMIQNNYFEFNYDLNSQQLLGRVDLGGESAGEMYLKGDVDQGFSLIMVEPSGDEKVIDRIKSQKLKVKS
jgi:hypothetical protein